MTYIIRLKIIFNIYILFIQLTLLSNNNEIDNFLYFENSKYIIEFEFVTKCNKEKLMEIFYDFNHLKEFTNSKNTRIIKLDTGENWYNVQYNYNYFIYKSEAIYKKTIIPEDYLVEFKLLNFNHNIGIVPKVISSSGYYKITSENYKNIVTYYQETELERKIQWLHLKIVENETKEFLKSLKEYVTGFEVETE